MCLFRIPEQLGPMCISYVLRNSGEREGADQGPVSRGHAAWAGVWSRTRGSGPYNRQSSRVSPTQTAKSSPICHQMSHGHMPSDITWTKPASRQNGQEEGTSTCRGRRALPSCAPQSSLKLAGAGATMDLDSQERDGRPRRNLHRHGHQQALRALSSGRGLPSLE